MTTKIKVSKVLIYGLAIFFLRAPIVLLVVGYQINRVIEQLRAETRSQGAVHATSVAYGTKNAAVRPHSLAG